jgi:hypothetical protein
MASITQVQNTNKIINAEFLKIQIPGIGAVSSSTYTFSTSYRSETFEGTTFVGTYTAMGGLVSISEHQRDLSATSYDTAITLVGVDQTQIGQVIDSGLKGAKVEIWRGFYNDDYTLQGDLVKRYTGIITSFDISEDRVEDTDAFTLSLHCSSFKRVLENRIAGRHTNSASWKNVYATDTSMDKIPALSNSKFNFGQKA